jgi:hypothetical protein
VAYFAVGNSSECFGFIKDWVEKKIRRHMARARNRNGFGWKRWSTQWLYESLRLFNGYKVRWSMPKVAPVRFRSKFVFTVGSLFRLRVSQYLDHATFPVPATSNAACGFPALRSPVCFTPRVMGPIGAPVLDPTCEGLGVKLPGSTRQARQIDDMGGMSAAPPIAARCCNAIAESGHPLIDASPDKFLRRRWMCDQDRSGAPRIESNAPPQTTGGQTFGS